MISLFPFLTRRSSSRREGIEKISRWWCRGRVGGVQPCQGHHCEVGTWEVPSRRALPYLPMRTVNAATRDPLIRIYKIIRRSTRSRSDVLQITRRKDSPPQSTLNRPGILELILRITPAGGRRLPFAQRCPRGWAFCSGICIAIRRYFVVISNDTPLSFWL